MSEPPKVPLGPVLIEEKDLKCEPETIAMNEPTESLDHKNQSTVKCETKCEAIVESVSIEKTAETFVAETLSEETKCETMNIIISSQQPQHTTTTTTTTTPTTEPTSNDVQAERATISTSVEINTEAEVANTTEHSSTTITEASTAIGSTTSATTTTTTTTTKDSSSCTTVSSSVSNATKDETGVEASAGESSVGDIPEIGINANNNVSSGDALFYFLQSLFQPTAKKPVPPVSERVIAEPTLDVLCEAILAGKCMKLIEDRRLFCCLFIFMFLLFLFVC
jgi:hypothetical protein